MTELIEGAGKPIAGAGPTPQQQASKRVTRRRLATGVGVVSVVTALAAFVMASLSSSHNSAQPFKRVTLLAPFYAPRASVGTYDDYHCTLINPHLTKRSYVVSSQFKPGSAEVHHAVLSLVPPSLAATAFQDNAIAGGQGWTCFGAPSLPNTSLDGFLNTPYLGVWGPGHGADALPTGTGVPMPAGTLIIEQVHYNLLVGHKPVQNSLVIDTVPTSTPVMPLYLDQALAPPEVPCPPGVTGPLCDRAASIADQGRRFGQFQAFIPNGLEVLCGHDPFNPPTGDTASCLWPLRHSGYIVRVQPHMHLLGRSFSMILNPGTPQARTVLYVSNYNFHYQKGYNLSTPILVRAGDKVQVNCTYDPTLAQQLPILRKAPPHFVTWGDGSSDEMCVGLLWTAPSAPNAHSSV